MPGKTPNGIEYPLGSELVNFDVQIKNMADTTDTTIRKVAKSEAESAGWVKPPLTVGMDLNTITEPGLYPMDGASTANALGIPVGSSELGTLTVQTAYSSNYVLQTFQSIYNPEIVWERVRYIGTWGEWTESRSPSADGSATKVLGDISGSTPVNLDEVREAGWYAFANGRLPALSGIPVEGSVFGSMHIRQVAHSANYVIQEFRRFDGILDVQTFRRRLWGGVWGPWQDVTKEVAGGANGSEVDEPIAVTRNAILREDFTRRIGPVHTHGKAVIALRFDHGLTKFKSTILPLLKARGFPATVAMNSRTWSEDQNAGATQAEADSWDTIEFANHSATHEDAPTLDDMYDEIENGRAELAAQLPNHRIDGWIIPGVTGTRYQGWGNATTARQFADTPAGRMILEHHAWSSGHVPGSKYRPLDGQLRNGEIHYGIETASWSSVRNEIDAAVSRREGLCLMMHPANLDRDGYITTALLTQILDHIKAYVDAGAAVVLPIGKLLVADKYAGTTPKQFTGWLDITSSLTVTPTSGRLMLLRDGPRARLAFNDLKLPAKSDGATSGTIATLPVGFRPSFSEGQQIRGVSTIAQTSPYGYVQLYNWTPDGLIVGSITFYTDEPFPTT